MTRFLLSALLVAAWLAVTTFVTFTVGAWLGVPLAVLGTTEMLALCTDADADDC